jgi:hypothetical protein
MSSIPLHQTATAMICRSETEECSVKTLAAEFIVSGVSRETNEGSGSDVKVRDKAVLCLTKFNSVKRYSVLN